MAHKQLAGARPLAGVSVPPTRRAARERKPGLCLLSNYRVSWPSRGSSYWYRVVRSTGRDQESFTLVWWWHQLLSGSLANGRLSRVSLRLGRELFTLYISHLCFSLILKESIEVKFSTNHRLWVLLVEYQNPGLNSFPGKIFLCR